MYLKVNYFSQFQLEDHEAFYICMHIKLKQIPSILSSNIFLFLWSFLYIRKTNSLHSISSLCLPLLLCSLSRISTLWEWFSISSCESITKFSTASLLLFAVSGWILTLPLCYYFFYNPCLYNTSIINSPNHPFFQLAMASCPLLYCQSINKYFSGSQTRYRGTILP